MGQVGEIADGRRHQVQHTGNDAVLFHDGFGGGDEMGTLHPGQADHFLQRGDDERQGVRRRQGFGRSEKAPGFLAPGIEPLHKRLEGFLHLYPGFESFDVRFELPCNIPERGEAEQQHAQRHHALEGEGPEGEPCRDDRETHVTPASALRRRRGFPYPSAAFPQPGTEPSGSAPAG